MQADDIAANTTTGQLQHAERTACSVCSIDDVQAGVFSTEATMRMKYYGPTASNRRSTLRPDEGSESEGVVMQQL